MLRRALFLLSVLAVVAGCGDAAPAGPVTDVTATLTDDGITLDSATVPSGRVSFEITNEGNAVHEFEIFTGRADDLTVENNVAVTASLDLIDEVEDIVPGMSLTLDVTLEPGEYVIICNLPGHVTNGMVVDLDVTG
ncbi:MAG: cupredoxin domain-containing protein [Acidimicrobiia bacterium]